MPANRCSAFAPVNPRHRNTLGRWRNGTQPASQSRMITPKETRRTAARCERTFRYGSARLIPKAAESHDGQPASKHACYEHSANEPVQRRHDTGHPAAPAICAMSANAVPQQRSRQNLGRGPYRPSVPAGGSQAVEPHLHENRHRQQGSRPYQRQLPAAGHEYFAQAQGVCRPQGKGKQHRINRHPPGQYCRGLQFGEISCCSTRSLAGHTGASVLRQRETGS